MKDMQPIHPAIYLTPMNPPELERVISLRSFVFIIQNILTLGVYGSFEALSKHHTVDQLSLEKADLLNQMKTLAADWEGLEADLRLLREDIGELYGNDPSALEIKHQRIAEIAEVEAKNTALKNRSVQVKAEANFHIGRLALDAICFFGYVVANWMTAGIYGFCQNYALKNRIITLEAENNHLVEHIEAFNKKKAEEMSFSLGHLSNEIDVRTVDEANVLAKMDKVSKDLDKVKKDVTVLTTSKAAVEAVKELVQSQLIEEKNKVQELEDETKLLRAQARKRQAEEAEIAHLRDQLKKIEGALPEANRLLKLNQIGPLDSKYKPRKGEIIKQIPGAMDVTSSEKSSFEWGYNKRYSDKRSAAEIVEESFGYAFDQLIKEAAKGKINFNKSKKFHKKIGAYAVYRYMVLDLLKGAKLHQPSCHGFELEINQHNVAMLPSQSEMVLHYKPEFNGDLKPKVIFRYKRRDDFTPDEGTLLLRDGVDPVSAKWIYNQLSEKGKNHLFNLLMSDVIENDHPELIETHDFMKRTENHEVKLIQTAYDLISDMSNAIELKFRQNVLVKCWKAKATEEVKPFVKSEDKGVSRVNDRDKSNMVREVFVPWTLDQKVLGKYYQGVQQAKFANLVQASKERYELVFKHLPDILENPIEDPTREFDTLTLMDIDQFYFRSHQMIGQTLAPWSSSGVMGGAHCLFSNLLATLFNNKTDLFTGADGKGEGMNHFYCLKNAMANYLDDAEHAKKFELTIKNTHHCSVASYKKWLRGKEDGWDFQTHQWVSRAVVNFDQLTPLEIEIAAYALGVRIAVLTIGANASAKVDTNGLIVPKNSFDYYGPNTKEFLLMGASKDYGGTYYGLFPKIHCELIDKNQHTSEWNEIVKTINYWELIAPGK